MAFVFSKSGNITYINGGNINVRTKDPGSVSYNESDGKIRVFFSGFNVLVYPDSITSIDGAAPSGDIETLLSQIIACMPDADNSSAKAAAITPHDSTNLARATRGVYVGGAGNVVAIVGGTAITFTGVAAGTILPIQATRINSTSTTATALVALY